MTIYMHVYIFFLAKYICYVLYAIIEHISKLNLHIHNILARICISSLKVAYSLSVGGKA